MYVFIAYDGVARYLYFRLAEIRQFVNVLVILVVVRVRVYIYMYVYFGARSLHFVATYVGRTSYVVDEKLVGGGLGGERLINWKFQPRRFYPRLGTNYVIIFRDRFRLYRGLYRTRRHTIHFTFVPTFSFRFVSLFLFLSFFFFFFVFFSIV